MDPVLFVLGLVRCAMWGLGILFAARERRYLAVLGFVLGLSTAVLGTLVAAGVGDGLMRLTAPIFTVALALIISAFLTGSKRRTFDRGGQYHGQWRP